MSVPLCATLFHEEFKSFSLICYQSVILISSRLSACLSFPRVDVPQAVDQALCQSLCILVVVSPHHKMSSLGWSRRLL